MRLHWNGVEVDNVVDLLWHINQEYPLSKNSATPSVLQTDNTTEPNLNSIVVGPSSLQEDNDNDRSPALFALVIGINKYKDPEITPLHGAVNDADAIENFLLGSKKVISQGRIVNLRNEEATRENILEALESLACNDAIKTNDPILIYYAGHGSEAPAPNGWETSSGKIQMLLPHDFKRKDSHDKGGLGILDRELSQSLMNLSEKKSDNITVIFDCCYSGSGTRGNPNDETLAVRSVELPVGYSVPVAAFRSGTHRHSAPQSSGPSSSHVLLAACKPDQFAIERDHHGAFTSALLKLLNNKGVDTLTYADVIMRLPDLSMQTPQCEGVNRDRTLFNSEVHGRRVMYPIKKHHPTEYILEAGEAHGLTNGAKFTIYSDKQMSTVLGSVTTTRTTPFKSVCSSDSPFSLSSAAYAVQTHVGEEQDLCLFIELDNAFLDLFMELGKEMKREDSSRQRSFRLVDTELDQPELILRAREGLVQFELTMPICRQFHLTQMPFHNVRTSDLDHLLPILHSAADFYWHLHHSNKNGFLAEKVHLECLELEPSGLSDDLTAVYIPKAGGRNLIQSNTIFIHDAREENAKDDERRYGYRITNKSDDSLCVALFYFDISNLSISNDCSIHIPRTTLTKMSAANKAVSVFQPGDNSTLGQKVDVGFVKLYISTKHVDYSAILQDSPFVHPRGTSGGQKNREHWDVIKTPIIIQHTASH
ncbi:hypothetical protein DXG01_012738 [Tephrocybe rancida]|nr:hypothetical protein DXG01_012738 [Tephrocybe rancida]